MKCIHFYTPVAQPYSRGQQNNVGVASENAKNDTLKASKYQWWKDIFSNSSGRK